MQYGTKNTRVCCVLRCYSKFVKFKQEKQNINLYCNDCVKEVETKLNKREDVRSIKQN